MSHGEVAAVKKEISRRYGKVYYIACKNSAQIWSQILPKNLSLPPQLVRRQKSVREKIILKWVIKTLIFKYSGSEGFAINRLVVQIVSDNIAKHVKIPQERTGYLRLLTFAQNLTLSSLIVQLANWKFSLKKNPALQWKRSAFCRSRPCSSSLGGLPRSAPTPGPRSATVATRSPLSRSTGTRRKRHFDFFLLNGRNSLVNLLLIILQLSTVAPKAATWRK